MTSTDENPSGGGAKISAMALGRLLFSMVREADALGLSKCRERLLECVDEICETHGIHWSVIACVDEEEESEAIS
ncbi:MAG: hypothetical protein AB7V39_20240, partial [Nitrospiraceae bacterium]